MAVYTFRVTDEEDAAIRVRMALACETNCSAHIKRVYFQGAAERDEQVGQLRRQVAELVDLMVQSRNEVRKLVGRDEDGMELRLLAGLYMLLYPSVDDVVQAKVDPYLDIGGIESFLKSQHKRRR